QSALPASRTAPSGRRSAHDPVHAFRVGDSAWGVQFHPEFDAHAMRDYIDRLAGPLKTAGLDPEALRERVQATGDCAQLLGRFARIAEARQGL
ncbi:GMP synthase, partial [Variovorax sp. CT11-76]